MTCFGLTIVSL